MTNLLTTLLLAAPSEPRVTPPLGYVCGRAGAPVVVDGRLDDAAWQAAPWSAPFVDIEGDARPRPAWRTRVKMLWDDDYFYLAAELEEPHVWATLTEHDSIIFQDNDFEVFIDPDGDSHEYYEFEINALGTTWDLRLPKPYKDGGSAVDAWEIPGLRAAVWVDGTINDPRDVDRGWSLELAFPWPVLGEYAACPAPPRPGDQWRINFSRVEWDVEVIDGVYRKVAGRPEHNWVWSPQGVIDMHRPERWGYVQFEQSAETPFRPDDTAPARELLHRVYYAQRRWQAEQGDWCGDLAALGFDGAVELRRTADGWQAAAGTPDGRRLVIRHDARISVE